MSFIYAYKELPDDLELNGITLIDWKDLPEISRIINNKFTFYGNYKIDGKDVDYLEKGNFIKALDEDGKYKYFEINNVVKNLNSFSVTGRAIGYMANRNFIEYSFTSVGNGTKIMNDLKGALAFAQPFNYFSNVGTTHQFTAKQVKPIEAMIGSNNGNQNLVGVTGGELEMDNYDLKLVKQIGTDNGYRIDFGINLEAIEEETDDDNVFNSLYLIGGVPENDYDDDKEPITYKYLEVSGVTDKTRRITRRENSSITEKDALIEWGQSLFDVDRIHEPKVTHSVSMVSLEHTVEYGELYKRLSSLHFGDVAYCTVQKLGIEVKERMVEYTWFPTLKKFKTIVLGNDLSLYTNNIATETQQLRRKLDNRTETLIQNVLNATAWITGNKGGHVVFRPEKAPSEILIMDTRDVATAKRVWRWNLNGLGYSDNGINGPYGIAMTSKGEIVADFIKVGTIQADVFESSFNNLGDVMRIVQGTLQVLNDGKKIMELTKKGLEFWWNDEQVGTIGTAGNPFPGAIGSDEQPIIKDGNSLLVTTYDNKRIIGISPKTAYGLLLNDEQASFSLTNFSIFSPDANKKLVVSLAGDVNITGSLMVNGKPVTGGGSGGGGGNLGTIEDYAKNMITAEFNVDYDKMYSSYQNFGRIKAWGLTSRATFDELNQIIRDNGVSPVFFWAYEGGEGYHPSLSFLNHFYTNGSSYQEECRRTAAWVKETSLLNGSLAWYDAQYPYYTSPADKQAIGNAYMAETVAGMIARVMLQGTAAATWAMFDPAALSGSVNGVQDYADPFAHQITLIQSWQKPQTYVAPLDSPITITSPFGWRDDPFGGGAQFHSGIDLVNGNLTAPIYAIAAGTVIYSGIASGYGEYIAIQHADGIISGYGHMASGSRLVSVGETVSQGQRIATIGTTGDSTGIHLDLQMKTSLWPANNDGFMDPASYINF